MERVVQYINKKFKHAGNSKEVQSQKEELIASMHDKMNDLIAQGRTEDDAFREAVASLDELEELTSALDGNRKTIYSNRLNFHHSLLMFAVIAFELLAVAVYWLLKYWPILSERGRSVSFYNGNINALFFGLGMASVAVAIWPLVCGIFCRSNPAKVEQAGFDFRKSFTIALIGWLSISLMLAVFNSLLPIYDDVSIATGIQVIYWFLYPMIGISNWPLSILLYNRLYRNRRYLA